MSSISLVEFLAISISLKILPYLEISTLDFRYCIRFVENIFYLEFYLIWN